MFVVVGLAFLLIEHFFESFIFLIEFVHLLIEFDDFVSEKVSFFFKVEHFFVGSFFHNFVIEFFSEVF